MTQKIKVQSSPGPLKEKDVNASPAAADLPNREGPEKQTGKRKSTDNADALSTKKQKTSPEENFEQRKSKDPKKSHESMTTDLPDIHLEHQDSGDVPIYDTCDDIRKKMNDHLRKIPNANQSSFARELSIMLPPDTSGKVEGRHVGAFLKKKGSRNGAHTLAFYAAYVYFEKLRIKQGRAKSKKREEMENAWKEDGGFPRKGSHNQYLLCAPGEKPKLDSLGRLQTVAGGFMSAGMRKVK